MSDVSTARSPRANPPSAGRGIALVAFAALIGIFLLWKGPAQDSQTLLEASRAGSGQTQTSTKETVATTVSTVPPPTTAIAQGQLTITVANGSGKPKVAGLLADKLKGANYVLAKATNTNNGTVTATAVYFDAGYEVDAKAVAAAAGLNVAAVAARPTTGVPLEAADQAAKVLVILGTDYTPSAVAPSANATSGASG